MTEPDEAREIPYGEPHGRVAAPLLASSGLGFAFGAGLFATWQIAVESAQALAGTVSYPVGNAFYQYHLKAWTILHQLLAPWLAIGLSERAVSIFVSGMLGALSFAALTLCTFTLCRHVLLSILSPILVLAIFGVNEYYGVIYPIFMMGTVHAYGVAGRGMALGLLAAYALGYRRTAFLLLGLAPAVHATWGLWTLGVTLIVLAWERRLTVAFLKAHGPWFAAGVALSAISFGYQTYISRDLPRIDPALQAAHLEAFFTHWDFHRRPVNFGAPGIFLTMLSLALSTLWLSAFRKHASPAAATMCRILVVAAIAGLAGCALTRLPGALPDLLNMAMPGRFVNFSIFALPALLLGLLGCYLDKLAAKALVTLHILYAFWVWVFMTFLASDRFGWRLDHWKEFFLCAIAVVLLAGIPSRLPRFPEFNARLERLLNPALAMATVALLAGIAALNRHEDMPLFASEPDKVLEAAAAGDGMLITTGAMDLIQLRTRRPILLNVGALDQVSQAPSSIAEMAHVLDRVYGIDIFDPPQDIRTSHHASLLPDSSRELWESRSLEEWQAIAREFDAWDVLTYSDWKLQLPERLVNKEFRLYEIPRQ